MGPRRRLLEKPADPHRHDVARRHVEPGGEAFEDQIETVERRRTRASGQAQHRVPAAARQQEEIARIDGHSEMEHLAPGGHDAAGDDVTAIDDGRCARDQHELRTRVEGVADGGGDGAGIVIATGIVHDAAAQRFDAGPEHPGGLVEHRLLRRREPGLDDGGGRRLEGCDTNRRPRTETRERAIEHFTGHGERNHLDRREHLALAHRPRPRQRGHGQRLVDRVEPIDVRHREHEEAIGRREQVAAPGKRPPDTHPGAGEGLRRGLRRYILHHVAGVDPRPRDHFEPFPLQEFGVRAAQHPALFERPAAGTYAVREHDAGRVCNLEPTELHTLLCIRKAAVISATIDAAISPAVTAPISSPTGAWILASVFCANPAPVSRSMRLPWVRRLPRLPM